MSERPSRDEHTVTSTGVDDEVKRRLREAYLNDEARELVVTAVRSSGDEVVVEFRLPHGEETHTERFMVPKHGSLADSTAFLTFLDAAGVSPLDVDELVGTRVPATYDADTGWHLGDAYVTDRSDETKSAEPWQRSARWLRTNRDWLLAALLIVGELLFVAGIIIIYG